jgi:hypothetical protein
MQFDGAGAGFPVTLAVAVAVGEAIGRTSAVWGTSEALDRGSRRFMFSSVIVGSLVGVEVRNQTLPKIRDEHRGG